jgi:hypothetical protein
MRRLTRPWVLLFPCAGVLTPGWTVRAEDDDDEDAGYGDRAAVVTNKTHRETCGACHLAYPPMLLPASSWKKIVTNMKQHNGQTVELEANVQNEILGY